MGKWGEDGGSVAWGRGEGSPIVGMGAEAREGRCGRSTEREQQEQ